MRVADYIANYIYNKGIDTVFGLVGGGAMFLNDGILNSPLKWVSCHHEQAATMAASGYARYSGKPGVCYVTTGCGGTNALTGVLGAYQDNIPMIIISGQCKCKETIQCTKQFELRQLGVQEADIATDDFTAEINGATTDFTLTDVPVTASLQVFIDGIYRIEGSGKDYELNPDSGQTKTIRIAGDALVAGQRLVACYVKDN